MVYKTNNTVICRIDAEIDLSGEYRIILEQGATSNAVENSRIQKQHEDGKTLLIFTMAAADYEGIDPQRMISIQVQWTAQDGTFHATRSKRLYISDLLGDET